MGRIKSTLVKRASVELMHQGIEILPTFEHNKKLLGSTMPSKKMRNKIAGYMARLRKAEIVKASKPEPKKVILEE